MTFRPSDEDDAIARELRMLGGLDDADLDDPELQAAREVFATRAEPFDALAGSARWSRPHPISPSPRRAAVILAIAAGLAITALASQTSEPEPSVPALRPMGGSPADLAVQLVSGPGDAGALRLRAVLPEDAEPGWLTVATVQDDGSSFVLASGTSHPAGPGEVWLDGRIRLDDYPGREWLVVTHGPQPLSDHAVQNLLNTSLDALTEGRPPKSPAHTSIWTTELREARQ